MKILHVLDISIPRLAGYSTRSYYLIHHQKEIDISPVVLTSERFGKTSNDKEEIDNISYYRSKVCRNRIRKIPLLSETHEIRCLKKRIEQIALTEHVDIIHAHSPSLIGAASIYHCKKYGIPLVYEIRAFWEDAAVDRGSFSEKSLQYIIRRFHETIIIKRATKIIAISNGIKEDLIKRGIPEEKIHIVRNGVDFQKFKPVPVNNNLKRKYGCHDKIIIGFIGSFFNFEGLQDLIFAFKKISQKNNNVILMLVGAGQMDDYLRNLTKELKITDRVIFTGHVSHDRIIDFYSVFDLLIYPRISKRITELVTPLKPLEAMSMEKPVLMSDVDGLRELVDTDDSAMFFKAGDVDELASKCLFLCEKKPLRIKMGKKARVNIIRNWGWDKRARINKRIYEQILR